MIGQRMFPIAMESDATLSDRDVIDASLAKVDEADAYIGLIGYRYGLTPVDHARNPEQLSLSELEFRRAVARGIFGMHVYHASRAFDFARIAPRGADFKQKLSSFSDLARKSCIYSEFEFVPDLKAKAVQCLVKLREVLDNRSSSEPSAPDDALSANAEMALPIPPALYAKSAYTPGFNLVGRQYELDAICKWATADDPVLVIQAIGGMGKSALTWQWMQQHARHDRNDWAGILWDSFYVRGADMNDFCVTALAYMTQRPQGDFRGLKTSELASELLLHLRHRPWLLLLDGFQQVLVAYDRRDAQANDDDVDADLYRPARVPEACAFPVDDELLQRLSGAVPSKTLLSSRLMPSALLNPAGHLRPGVHRMQLRGIELEGRRAYAKRNWRTWKF